VGSADLPDLPALWDYGDPAASRTRFEAAAEQGLQAGHRAYHAEALTQIARTLGLELRFAEAHAVLDRADAEITPEMTRARVYVLLERGRAYNSSNAPEKSVPLFREAMETAQGADLESLAIDAAHMLGIAETGEASIAWNERAIAMAGAARDPHARGWRGALSNNLGWTYYELGRYEDALRMFELHKAVRTEQKNESQIGIAQWSIAKTYRALGRVQEALEMQRAILERPERKDKPAEGYTHEELAECLTLLGHAEVARPHFARAWELLRTDPWLKRDEPLRLERLQKLGQP
jgi:tetratricopeptide (TPR) repeat protein